MNWTKLAEDRIAEAIANGEFQDLPGRGQPLDWRNILHCRSPSAPGPPC